MATDRKHDALSTLRGFLTAHRQDYRAKLSGLDQTLAALDAAMVEQAIRQADLAIAICIIEQFCIGLAPTWQEPFTQEVRQRLRVIFQTGRDLR